MAFGDDHVDRPKKVDTIRTEKPIPVLIGGDYQHVMAQATIEQKAARKSVDDDGHPVVVDPAEVIITIVAKGPTAQQLGDFVAAMEVVALSFQAVPVKAHDR